MATKKRSGKATAKKKAPLKAVKKKPTAPEVAVIRRRNAVTIAFDRPEDLLPHLLDLASNFAEKHFDGAAFTLAEDNVLGTAAARQIVSGCANSDCWSCTLGELKRDANLFQACVSDEVQSKGYSISRNDIPASQSTQLYTVVMATQNAPKKAGA